MRRIVGRNTIENVTQHMSLNRFQTWLGRFNQSHRAEPLGEKTVMVATKRSGRGLPPKTFQVGKPIGSEILIPSHSASSRVVHNDGTSMLPGRAECISPSVFHGPIDRMVAESRAGETRVGKNKRRERGTRRRFGKLCQESIDKRAAPAECFSNYRVKSLQQRQLIPPRVGESTCQKLGHRLAINHVGKMRQSISTSRVWRELFCAWRRATHAEKSIFHDPPG